MLLRQNFNLQNSNYQKIHLWNKICISIQQDSKINSNYLWIKRWYGLVILYQLVIGDCLHTAHSMTPSWYLEINHCGSVYIRKIANAKNWGFYFIVFFIWSWLTSIPLVLDLWGFLLCFYLFFLNHYFFVHFQY